MKTNLTKVCAAAFSTILLAGLATSSNAQVTYPYVGDFEVANTTPAAKSYADTATITMNGMTWKMPGVFLGTMTVGDRKNGDKSARVRLTNNTTGTPAYLEMQANLPNGAGVVSYKAGRYGSDAVDSIQVFYSTNNGASWTSAGIDQISDTILNTYSHTLNVSGNVRLKFQKVNAITGTTSSRVSFDDINITSYSGTAPVTTHIVLQSKSPAHNATNVPLTTDKLIMKFDSAVAAGTTGNIKLVKTGGNTQTFAVPSANVTFSNDSVIVNNIVLDNNSSYHVEYDSTVATNIGGNMRSVGIYNATTWVFSTEDTVTPPPPTPMTSLNEPFTNCTNEAMGVFVQYSKLGSNRNWRCSSTYGVGDTKSVYMNGGSGSGSEENEDWLITNAPLDFSAMTNPTLSFYQKRRFSGTLTRSVKVSTDYVAGTDPATATWVDINIPAFANTPDTVFTLVNNISLTAHKATPFYLAFVYESPATGTTWEWTLDNIKVEEPTSVKTIKGANVGVQVLGEPTANNINLNIEMMANDNIELQLFDLLGRKVAAQKVNALAGTNRVSFSNLNLNAGMYVIRVITSNGFGTVKAVVK